MFAHVAFLANVTVSAAENLYAELNEAIVDLQTQPRLCPIYVPKILINAELRYIAPLIKPCQIFAVFLPQSCVGRS